MASGVAAIHVDFNLRKKCEEGRVGGGREARRRMKGRKRGKEGEGGRRGRRRWERRGRKERGKEMDRVEAQE